MPDRRIVLETSDEDTPSYRAVRTFSTNTEDLITSSYLDDVQHHFSEAQARLSVVRAITSCAELTGGRVSLRAECHHMPAVIDRRGGTLAAYEFVEFLDGELDYRAITEALDLEVDDVDSLLAFIRRVMMINPNGYDPDAVEDEHDADDQQLIDALRNALEQEGEPRVLGSE